MSFTYGSEGVRTSKTANGVTTTYYYRGNQLVGEENNLYRKIYLYDMSGSAVGFMYQPASTSISSTWFSFYYEKNIFGDVVAVYDHQGIKQVSYTYDAYGNFTTAYHNGATSASVAATNSITYRGYYYDSDLGLYYLISRYYDPNTGRFINADCYIQTPDGNVVTSANMFVYCGNNPVDRYDPNGEGFLTATICGIAVWKISIAVVALITTFIVVDSIAKNPSNISSMPIPEIEATPKTESEELSPSLPKLPAKDPTHHIVAKADLRAAESRQILRDVGIDPWSDPRNLVVLPKSYHATLHTSAYHNYVTERLRPVAGDKAGVEAVLESIRAEILAHAAAGIRWN